MKERRLENCDFVHAIANGYNFRTSPSLLRFITPKNFQAFSLRTESVFSRYDVLSWWPEIHYTKARPFAWLLPRVLRKRNSFRESKERQVWFKKGVVYGVSLLLLYGHLKCSYQISDLFYDFPIRLPWGITVFFCMWLKPDSNGMYIVHQLSNLGYMVDQR